MKSHDSQRLLKHYDVWEHNFITIQNCFFITHESMSEILLTARFCNESPQKICHYYCATERNNDFFEKKYDVDK